MLKQKFALSYISQILIQIIAIVSSIFVARIAGPTILGAYTYAMAYASTFSFLMNLGLGSAHLKIVSSGYPLDKCLGTYVRLLIFPICLYLIVTTSIVIYQSIYTPKVFDSNTVLICVVLFIVSNLIGTLTSIITLTYNAQLKQAKSDIPNIVVKVIESIGRIIIVTIGLRLLGLSVWNVVVSIILLVFYMILSRGLKIGKYDKELAKEYIKNALPLTLVMFANTQLSNLDKVMLKYFASSTDVGYYGASFRIGGFIQLIAASIGTIFFPLFTKALTDGNKEVVVEKIHLFERFSDIFILPLVMYVVLFSDIIIKILLGKSYYPSIIPMSIITLALYISVQTSPYMNVITGSGKFYKLSIYLIQMVVGLIITMFIFVSPKMLDLKSNGTAISLLIVNLYGAFIFRRAAKKIVPGLRIFKNAKIWLLVAITTVLTYFLYNDVISIPLGLRIPFSVLFLIVIYGELWVLKIMNKTDKDLILNILNPKSVVDYIRQEFAEKL